MSTYSHATLSPRYLPSEDSLVTSRRAAQRWAELQAVAERRSAGRARPLRRTVGQRLRRLAVAGQR